MSSKNAPAKKSSKIWKFLGIILSVIGCTALLYKSTRFRAELKHVAMNQFQQMIYGRENYCDEHFEHWHIANALIHRIIGQENALNQINAALQSHKNITAIAFVGTQGVGKTLTLNLIQEQFQWHLNIQQYIWSLIKSPQDQLKYLTKSIDTLTTCGHNGIFVDYIPMQYIDIINEFNRKLLAHCNENHIKLIVFYVFQTHNPIEASKQLQLENVKTINFRQFDTNDIRNCINMESERLKIAITPKQMNELLEDIDAKRHGCKNVAARIARQETQDL